MKRSRKTLTALSAKDRPKALISELAENLLQTFEKAPLLDAYDVYQHLMTYWADSMQDDVYMIVTDDWEVAARLRLTITAEGKAAEKADLTVDGKKYRAELIPPSLVVNRFFAKEKAAIETLEQQRDAITQELEELAENHSGEGGALEQLSDGIEEAEAGRCSGTGCRIRQFRAGRILPLNILRVPRPLNYKSKPKSGLLNSWTVSAGKSRCLHRS